MTKYGVRWCRIWEFKEEIEAETEKEAYEKILEERATAGSTIEILSVWHISREEVKQEVKEEEVKAANNAIAAMERERYKDNEARITVKPRKKKEKK